MRRSPLREALRREFVKHAESVRLEKVWSYTKMGEELGISKQGYQKYLIGSSAPSDRTLRKAKQNIGFEQFTYKGFSRPTVLPTAQSEEPIAEQLSLPLQFFDPETQPDQSSIRIPLGRAGHIEHFLELKLSIGRSRNAS